MKKLDLFSIISEEKIREAYKNGEFQNLPGYGKPLAHDEAANVPEELRMAYRLLKNAGYSPEENDIKKEMLTIEDLIKNCYDEEERERLKKKFTEKLLQYNRMLSKKRIQTNSSIFKNYEHKIEKKLLE